MTHRDINILRQYCEDGIVLTKEKLFMKGELTNVTMVSKQHQRGSNRDSIDSEAADDSPSLPDNDSENDGDNAALW